ncbi:Panacea domain-containing protein [Arthrobacter sp. H14]|uniref:Panacea domain-containing protein n=1 Tax=Arthrobacter sp. H14 TaxID=1312959 RepID=UPI0004B0D026|nr:type II toxin-antitoxin system antitoxin SocA domain-containing protein [Arthrobacter sp. H14]
MPAAHIWTMTPDRSIFDLAAYILARTGEITTMKLHKLCYYSQAWHLVWDSERLTDAEFHAYGMGPVSPELYETHRGIFTVASLADTTAGEGNPDVFDGEQQESINAILEAYLSWKNYQLTSMTKQEQPWKDAWGNTVPGSRGGVISEQTMLAFYTALDDADDKDNDS